MGGERKGCRVEEALHAETWSRRVEGCSRSWKNSVASGAGAGVKWARGSGEKVRGQWDFMESLAGHSQDFWKPLEGFKQIDSL